MNLISLCGAALCAVFMLLVVREIRRDHAFLITLAVGVLFFGVVIYRLREGVDYINELAETESVSAYAGILLKALGITYLTEITQEICKSCGEPAVSGYVEAVGKAEMLLLCLPLIRDLTAAALRYI